RLEVPGDLDGRARPRVAIRGERLEHLHGHLRKDAELAVEAVEWTPRQPVNTPVDGVRPSRPCGAHASELEVVLDDGRSKPVRERITARRKTREPTPDDDD